MYCFIDFEVVYVFLTVFANTATSAKVSVSKLECQGLGLGLVLSFFFLKGLDDKQHCLQLTTMSYLLSFLPHDAKQQSK